jgi:hypothetical protein
MENYNNDTLSFIQLVKSIIEYYGTTKQKPDTEIVESLNSDELSLFESIGELNFDQIIVKIPKEIDDEIKKTFLNQLKKYQLNN